MKIFVSWSGELSKKIAQALKKWIPCIIQSVDVFYSPEDIEKGENWDSKISAELSQCNYGIVCLTSENTLAPWIHFEAGALAKTLESRVSALMVDIKTSDIQGPLKRYQATKLERDDVWQLISDINNATDSPLDVSVLEGTFNAIWNTMYSEIGEIISSYIPKDKSQKVDEKIGNNEAIEEILQIVRKQNVLLCSPEQLFPPHYFAELQQNSKHNDGFFCERLLKYLDVLLEDLTRTREIYVNNNEEQKLYCILKELRLADFISTIIRIVSDEVEVNPRLRRMALRLKDNYMNYWEQLR
ncbi:MAG: toll/interleukin-1 receptor domain-containing protein [Oscillospiraceae bacterium]|nr:toll/interleukin-1 receptor domain-containing protein [Oscillospiraceae bacterium]